MADNDIAGGCCIFIFSALNAWCNTQTFGANGCCNSNTAAGCCGSCFDNSFNEDTFDEQVKQNMEKTRDPSVPVENKDQLAPTPDMTNSAAAQDVAPLTDSVV